MLFYMPWYMIGSAVGGILAGIFYNLVLAPQFEDRNADEQVTKHTDGHAINDEDR